MAKGDAKDIYCHPAKRSCQRQKHTYADVGPPVLPSHGYKPNHSEHEQRTDDEQSHVAEALAVLWNIRVTFSKFYVDFF